MRRVAHFLDSEVLADSPPNDALVRAFREAGLGVDLFAPGSNAFRHEYGPGVQALKAEYGLRWLAREAWRPSWRRYALFSGTAEDPLAIVGALAALHRRPSIALVDEIKSGTYRGDARESWKRLCRAGIRRAKIVIVNDPARIELVRDYAPLPRDREILVYPGGYVEPPAPVDRIEQRASWGVPEGALLLGSSGGFNLETGAGWLVDSVQKLPNLHVVIQPLSTDAMTRFLLPRLRGAERLHVETRRLGWREAWAQAAALDVGMAIYLNPGPQFQRMGTSSNRLCMFLAMGVPVIASRQESFRFLEEYDCGVLVGSSEEFSAALRTIASRAPDMRINAERCWKDHVSTRLRYSRLCSAIGAILT